jgi:uncharacterized protein YbaA (DUF1428 family)
MPKYVDGYVLPVLRKNLPAYRRQARLGAKLWRAHGALGFCECVGEDLAAQFGKPFSRLLRLKPGETVVFSWIVFKSRAQRDRVNAKVMRDPRLARMMDKEPMAFDQRRMIYGGFEVLVDA